eukprot:CAMPEP_0115338156 /NCGR_PEP_ID=MMETSP0270-20121206/89921_1 /TAXON_ID=71861 /ORGANISM="Scrippsiella trochoidea, Strain CCMP3099" /LENGTH=77 /DNA_ID=CAMNT_0002759441 /DNA_START=65 /DNA_END=295 /DNA_ORIENTATION=+
MPGSGGDKHRPPHHIEVPMQITFLAAHTPLEKFGAEPLDAEVSTPSKALHELVNSLVYIQSTIPEEPPQDTDVIGHW